MKLRIDKSLSLRSTSHPVRVRGLKQAARVLVDDLATSHPVRVRGLKHVLGN